MGLGEALRRDDPSPPQIQASLLSLFSFAAEKPPPKPRPARKPKPERPPTSSSSDRWVQGLGRAQAVGVGQQGAQAAGRVWPEAP